MISLPVVLVVGTICVFVEGFFSGSEIAFVSADRTRLRQKAADGDRAAHMCEQMLARPEVLLATTLLGTNVAVTTFSVTATLFFLSQDWGASELLTVAMVTPFNLILGELVPKTFFQAHADNLVVRLIYPMRLISIGLHPLIWAIAAIAAGIANRVGGDRKRAFITRDELAMLIENGPNENSDMTEVEREMVANVFELSAATVEEVMVPLSEVTALPESLTLAEAVCEVADKQHSRMPVYRDRVDNVVGMIHVFDLLGVGDGGRDRPISEIAADPVFVPVSALAVELLVKLQRSGNQQAIVVDEYGGAVGIVTVEDLLEVVVGEIEDEHDDEPEPIVLERAGVWRAIGKVDVERVNEELGLNLPESEDFESLGGLMLDGFKRIPSIGESLVVGDITLRVVAASDRAIEEIQILRRKR